MMAMNFKCRIPKVFKSLKYSLLGMNVTFLFTAIKLFLAGVIILINFSEYDELITKNFFSLARFMIATSVIIFLISGFGFYVAISRKFYIIVAYVALLLIILVFDIVILVLGYSLSDNAESEIKSTMVESLQLYGTRIDITKMWDDLQMGYECCGVAGRFDWISNQIPVSCCHIDYGTISPFECNTANAYTVGCASALGEYLAQQAYIIGFVGVAVTILQVQITLFTMVLAWRSKSEQVELES